MKNKKIAAAAASAFISLCFLVGCSESVSVTTDELIRDSDIKPKLTATYEEYSKKALDDYFAVANAHIIDGEVDAENEEVRAAAISSAAKLFAYACYNERALDQYVFFADQEGSTDISAGSATAAKQEYYLRINETEKTCGYRYHYTIKKVIGEPTGTLGMFKGLFEGARTRITDKTDLLYRLEGSNIRVGAKNETLGVEMLECDWATGKDWGKPDIKMIKGDYIEPENIEEDIVKYAGDDNITMRANINILADNIVRHALIMEPEDMDTGKKDGYLIFMSINTEVANSDIASLRMLGKANGTFEKSEDGKEDSVNPDDYDCRWVEWLDDDKDVTGLSIIFRIWENGLFRTYTVSEKWQGKISGFSGTADSTTVYYYSYSDRDCDMTRYLSLIDSGKSEKGA